MISANIGRPKEQTNMLTQTKVYLSPKVTQIQRSFFDILMLASEFGGLIKVSSLAIFAMIIPIIEYLYFLVMIKRLYFAKTEKEGIFKPENICVERYKQSVLRRNLLMMEKQDW